MGSVSRRQFLGVAAALGATLAYGAGCRRSSAHAAVERRDLFPEGVASGDPDSNSVLLWTRRPFDDERLSSQLMVEIAMDDAFTQVVADARAPVSAEADWTCRVLVAGLEPGLVYWYRFIDDTGAASRIGRTRTAPTDDDPRPARFAFVSCQNICEGAQNAWRRMIYEDELATEEERLGFVLHLGDFIYEVVEYPEDRPEGKRYDRRLRYPVKFPDGRHVLDRFHVADSLRDYRTLYRAYLHDPDIQDARARWPFVPIWDNHEFSWRGWQSMQVFGDETTPAQTLKVAANQAWWEYQPARVAKSGGGSMERFGGPRVDDTPVTRFDEHGLGDEPNNLAAVNSLTAYRALRWGRHLELLITDQHSYRSREPTSRNEAKAFSGDFLDFFPEDIARILDAGASYEGGAPSELAFGDTRLPNFRRNEPPQSILGARQKAWFLGRLRSSQATWKVWGSSSGNLDLRADLQNLPQGVGSKRWPSPGYACFGGGDWSGAYTERAEIYEAVRQAGVAGFATVSGDRHSFWAGLAAKALPPTPFEPVGVAFITGSLSAPGLVEAVEHAIPKDDPLRPLYLAEVGGGATQPIVNLLLRHGVRAALEYGRHGDIARAEALGNPEQSPHLSFVDMGGHGYAKLYVDDERIESEFVCIPRPLERSVGADGGPLRYRVRHGATLWKPGERPRLVQDLVEGEAALSGAAGVRGNSRSETARAAPLLEQPTS